MNDATVIQLKIIVERAVRPVRASTARKRKMREELLAHVNAVFEEEAKLSAEAAALERTAQRFGRPAELTEQLQATVSASDTGLWFVESLIGLSAREPVLRRAVRHAALVGAMALIGTVSLMGLVASWSEWLTIARLPSILAPVWMALLTFCASLLVQGMRQSLFGLSGRRWPAIIALGVASWLIVPALNVGWCSAFSGDFVSSLLDGAPLFLTSLLGPVALVVSACAINPEIRYVEEWANLAIDQPMGASA